MTAPARLPDNAPFAPEAIDQLNRVLGPASATQRAWLAGFLSGLEASQPPAAAPPAARPKLTILFATESGNAEALAQAAKRDAARLGFAATLLDAADATPAHLAKTPTLLVIASTWGEGEAPQRATRFLQALLADTAPRLPGLRFAVLALGDRAYSQFCETGRAIDARLAELGAERAAPRQDCDIDYDTPAAAWLAETLPVLRGPQEDPSASVIHVDFGAPAPAAFGKSSPFQAEIAELTNLNSSRSGKQTFHVALDLAGSGLTYQPGDAIGILPQNDPAAVHALLDAAGLPADPALHEALIARHDIHTLTGHLVRTLAGSTGHPALAALAADPAALAAYLPGRQVIDLLQNHAPRPTPEQLLAALRPLAPRLYSVASSQRAEPEQAHLLVAAVRYRTHGRDRTGVASGWIADRRRAGDTLPIYVKPNPHFRLPADPDAPVIMIGPGTGVAPFRAFMQDREATGARGPTWLFYGDRRYTHDFLYQLDWQDWLKSGVLSRLDLAFSRDQDAKRYVQHAVLEQADRLRGWLADGAHLYICGDQAHMARDVEAALRTVADIDALRDAGRYKLDVY